MKLAGSPAGEPPIHRWLRLGVLAAFVAGIAAFFALGGHRYLALDALREHRDALLAYTEAHYAQAVLLAFAAFVAAILLCLPAGTVFALALGLLFGRWVGLLILSAAGTLGATLLFVLARHFFAAPLRRQLGRLGERVNDGFTRDAFHWMLFLRLMPIFPFFVVSLAPALTDMRVRTFAGATFLGILPGAFVYANLGQALGRIDSARQLLSAEAFVALTLLAVFSLAPIFVRRWRSKGG